VSTRAELSKKRYAEDPEYRAKKLASRRKWAKSHPEQVIEGKRRNRYGLSPGDFERLLARQNGACAICKVRPAETLHVDHCHATNKVRGLLCRYCNIGLGGFRDNPCYMLEGIAYLAEARGLFVVAGIVRWFVRRLGPRIERAFGCRPDPPPAS
jgi:recombination endonuclease VII